MYEFDCTLPGTGQEIKFRPITTGQMKKLLVYEDSTSIQQVEEALDKLKRQGQIYEPVHGKYKITGY